MDQRGHPGFDSGRHSRSREDKQDYYRYSQQDRDQNWTRPEAQNWTHLASPPPRPDQYPYTYPQHPYGYGGEDHQRPQSRHGYDYPPQSHWDYRDNYAYYDHEYYRGQHTRQDAAQWVTQDSWRRERYHEGKHKQEHSGNSYVEENRFEQRTDASQHQHLSGHEENPSRVNEEVSSFYLGTLEGSKTSGLSSSCYELSQYINGGEHADSVYVSDTDHGPVREEASAPLKYSTPHAVVSFGPAGQLLRVSPGFFTQESVGQVEIHSLEVILSETQEQQEMRNFPGPLTREDLHKVEAIEFAQQGAASCRRADHLRDRSSAALLWNLLILLCRQNGQMVGSDVAELLMQGSQPDGSWSESDVPTLIDFGEGGMSEAAPEEGDDLLTGSCSSFSSQSSQKSLQVYTRLLLAGRKKEALESAMSSGLWGHALFLASKMDDRSYSTVLSRFTGQLTASDPLQTLFQLLSGRIPSVTTSCGNEKLGDWRPHLAVMLSNESGHPATHQRSIVTMGDTLASRGLLHAAHVCYLTSSVPFGAFTQKAQRLVLLGSSHRQSFQHFAANSSIRVTELFEYSQTLGDKNFSIPSFQVYKFLYASRLLDCGLPSQAFHYCEVVGRALLRQREPSFVLTAEVIKLSDRLRHAEDQFGEAEQEADWLKQLRRKLQMFQTESYECPETHQPEPEECAVACGENRESGLNERRCEIQSPDPELFYRRPTEDQQRLMNQTVGDAEDVAAAPEWPRANPPVPVSPVPGPEATSQGLGYHNTNSVGAGWSSTHCPVSDGPSVAAEAATLPGTGMTGGQMLEVGVHHPLQNQHGVPPGSESPENQSTKAGWFTGWFISKPREKSSEQSDSVKTDLPPTAGFRPPPLPAMLPPDRFTSQPSSAGINPFSRKAGQQLG